jgi:hypothetical protein
MTDNLLILIVLAYGFLMLSLIVWVIQLEIKVFWLRRNLLEREKWHERELRKIKRGD